MDRENEGINRNKVLKKTEHERNILEFKESWIDRGALELLFILGTISVFVFTVVTIRGCIQ